MVWPYYCFDMGCEALVDGNRPYHVSRPVESGNALRRLFSVNPEFLLATWALTGTDPLSERNRIRLPVGILPIVRFCRSRLEKARPSRTLEFWPWRSSVFLRKLSICNFRKLK